MVGVGNNTLARVDVRRRQVANGECGHDHAARDALSEGCDEVGSPWREFFDGSDAAQHFVKRVELRLELRMEFGEEAGRQQFSGGGIVAFAQDRKSTRL